MKKLGKSVLLLFVALPLITVVYLSLVSAWAFPALFDASFGFKHYEGLFSGESELGLSFIKSLFLSLSMGAAGLIFGFFVAKELAFSKYGPRLLKLAFYPYLIAPVVLGAMLQFYFVRWGLSASFFGVMMAQALFILPYAVMIMSSFWSEKNKALLRLGQGLGGDAKTVNRTLLFPLAKPWMLLTFAQCFLISWFEYGMTQLVGIGKVKTLTVLSMQFLKEANPHPAAVAAVLMIVPVLLIFLTLYHWQRKAQGNTYAIAPINNSLNHQSKNQHS